MFPEEIATERLRLRRLNRENVPTMRLYDHMRAEAPGMEEVRDYVLWDPHESPRDTHEYLATVEEQWDDREQATYAIHPDEFEESVGANGDREGQTSDENSVETPEIAGTTNLHLDWERQSAELGIWLRKAFWGRGYSGERAAALLELAFDRLDLEVVGASHRDGNDRSRRAIEKYVEAFGGQYDGLLRNFVPTDDGVRDLHRFTVTRDQYREAVEGASDGARMPSTSDSS
ncbi:GNAT family N-acetyltransferase [Halorussus litoreus]|uniref:GNAT family N-acetyltransferase n=1 Tax=Halorussus litoreus TaxID=1710536 RepID=UPI000E27923C|nr:GNAT family protein [Halorussus litoreus]